MFDGLVGDSDVDGFSSHAVGFIVSIFSVVVDTYRFPFARTACIFATVMGFFQPIILLLNSTDIVIALYDKQGTVFNQDAQVF